MRSAEQVVAQLLSETDGQGADQSASWSTQEAGSAAVSGSAGKAVLVVPHRGDGADVADLPAEYQRQVQVVAVNPLKVWRRSMPLRSRRSGLSWPSSSR